MSDSTTSDELFDPARHAYLFQRSSIFLSASVPPVSPDDLAPENRQADARFCHNRHPAEIREAVAQLCRFAFASGIQLVFGGHPVISPLVLNGARRFAPDDGSAWVIVFQSMWFHGKIAAATRQLDLARGRVLWVPSAHDRASSLTRMRNAMVRSPGLIGAIFMGGMSGVFEESDLFDANTRGAGLRFPIGSTGAASRELLDSGVGASHSWADPQTLGRSRSYALVMGRIFKELGYP